MVPGPGQSNRAVHSWQGIGCSPAVNTCFTPIPSIFHPNAGMHLAVGKVLPHLPYYFIWEPRLFWERGRRGGVPQFAGEEKEVLRGEVHCSMSCTQTSFAVGNWSWGGRELFSAIHCLSQGPASLTKRISESKHKPGAKRGKKFMHNQHHRHHPNLLSPVVRK